MDNTMMDVDGDPATAPRNAAPDAIRAFVEWARAKLPVDHAFLDATCVMRNAPPIFKALEYLAARGLDALEFESCIPMRNHRGMGKLQGTCNIEGGAHELMPMYSYQYARLKHAVHQLTYQGHSVYEIFLVCTTAMPDGYLSTWKRGFAKRVYRIPLSELLAVYTMENVLSGMDTPKFRALALQQPALGDALSTGGLCLSGKMCAHIIAGAVVAASQGYGCPQHHVQHANRMNVTLSGHIAPWGASRFVLDWLRYRHLEVSKLPKAHVACWQPLPHLRAGGAQGMYRVTKWLVGDQANVSMDIVMCANLLLRHAVEDVPAECLDDLGKYLAEGFALACPEGAEGGVLPRQVQELTEEQRRKRMADYQKAARSLELGLVGDVSDSFVRHGKGMGLYMPDRRWGRPQYPRGA